MPQGSSRVPGPPSDLVADAVEAVKPRLRGVLHACAFVLSLATGAVLVVRAEGGRATTAAAVYAVSVALLFGTSAAYHRRTWSPRAEEVMQRLDHSMIFLLIAGTYTPFTLLVLEGAARWVVSAVVWGGALAGVLARNLVRTRSRWLFPALYVGLGWVAVPVFPALVRAGAVVFVALVVGGVLYSVGALVYAAQRPDPSPRWFGFHEVFHALAVLAFAAHYVAVTAAVTAAESAAVPPV